MGVARMTGACASAIRSWDVWSLPRWLAAYVVLVVVADVAMVADAARYLPVHMHDLILLAALLACSALTVELTRRAGENLGHIKDVYAVWELPVAILLPIAYAPLVPIVRFTLTQFRVRKAPLYRRAFSAAAIGLSYVAAAGVFRLVARLYSGMASDPAGHALVWMLVVAGCGVVQWLANEGLVLPAIKGSDPSMRLRDLFAKEPMYNDITELCVAVLVTFCVANSVIALVFAFPFVTLLQRSLRHVQLLNDSRADPKTGLLNSATWEHEAATEVSRAVRAKMPVAVALLDLDKFKSINDTYGHLTGDQVIKEVANTLDTLLRDYDLAGRFGGEEFALLLPHTRSTDALRIAERIRSAVGGLRFIAPGATGGERLSVTVSIGVAAIDGGDRREFKDLLATADAALYRAKASGRDQVQMISTTRGLSATAGPGATWAASDAHPEKPSVFRRAASS